MMVSQATRMAPIAAWCTGVGLKLVRGASGAGGRAALGVLAEALRRGESVVLAVDGPAGPPFRVKPGCLELARDVGVPLIPVGYHSRWGRAVPGRWDHSLLVTPFDRVVFEFGAPIDPRGGGSDAALLARVGAALNALDPGLR